MVVGDWPRHRARDADVSVRVVFAGEASPLPVMTVRLFVRPGPSRLIAISLFFGKGRRSDTSEHGCTALRIELLHALFIGGFAGGGRSLVGLDAGNIRGTVDVP
jgi:hypothetical protein